MPVDPQARAFLDQLAALNIPPMAALSPEVVREGMRLEALTRGEGEPVARVENRHIPGPASEIPIRIYQPEGAGLFPVLVYFHGGGWVIGDLDTHDRNCRSLANAASCLVVAVDYRLAPEHKFPAAVEDAFAATEWVASHAAEINGDPERIAVGGDSAGGNITAVVAQMARDCGGPRLVYQALIYPATDFLAETASMRENANGYRLSHDDMIWFANHYLNSENDGRNPLASPLRAASLSGLPPALVITAEYDPLRDEGEQYGARLREAGVPVTITRYDGMIHGFVSMTDIFDKGRAAIAECGQALRAAFGAV